MVKQLYDLHQKMQTVDGFYFVIRFEEIPDHSPTDKTRLSSIDFIIKQMLVSPFRFVKEIKDNVYPSLTK